MIITSITQKLASSTKFKKHIDKAIEDETKAARFLVYSNVIKDAVGTVFYVHQSLNNDKMPEEKRKFTAALDLSNGIFMGISQLLLGFTISDKRVQERICNKLFGSFEVAEPKKFKACKTGFAAISSLVIATIIAKRLIVPFISTPIASKIKTKYMDKDVNQSQISTSNSQQTNPENINRQDKIKLNFTNQSSNKNIKLTIHAYIHRLKTRDLN